MKKIISQFAIGLLLLILMAPLASGMTSSKTEVYATDTVAGYSTLIKMVNGPSNESIEVKVKKPDGGEIILTQKTDRYGKATLELEGFYTKKSGQYQLQARTTTQENYQGSQSFRVYPDEASPTRSTLELNKQTASANGNDYVELKVNLKDQYGNSLPGHTVQLISSRSTDEIVRISPYAYTDEQGKLIYHLYSQEKGLSTFLAHDSTANITLNDRARVAFYAPTEKSVAQGGHKVYLAATQSGPVSYLKIENLPETVKVNQTLNFAVSAYDTNGNIASNYTGLVRFSSTDSNATLPNDYQFEASDQGTHTFSLGLNLRSTGSQTVTVTDISNFDISGEADIQVTTSGTGQNSTSGNNNMNISGNGSFDLFTPAPGTYSSDTLTFSGEALYGNTIHILDNGKSIGTTDVKPNGSFTYKANGLSEGKHIFYLKAMNGAGVEQAHSNEINITIDTSAPELNQIKVSPEGDIPAGKLFTVTAYSEPNLSQVSLIFNNGIFEMTEDPLVDGVYKVSLTSPQKIGSYQIDALLIDELGNEITSSNLLNLKVVESTDSEPSTDEEILDPLEEETAIRPEKVTGLTVLADSKKVTLTWDGPIGEKETTIDEQIQTLNLTDDQLSTFEATLNKMTDEELNQLFEEFDGDIEAFMTAQMDKETESLTLDPNTGTGKLMKSSESTTSNPVDHYRIYYGPEPDLLYSHIDTSDNRTTWTIENLENGTTYYFTIVAVNKEGLESERSDIVSATPESSEEEALFAAAQEEARHQAELAAQAEALRIAQANAVTPDTGPEVLWLLALSLGFGFIYFKKEKGMSQINQVKFNDIH